MFLPDGTLRHLRRDINLPGHGHFLTFSCYRGYKLLSKDRTRQWLIDALARARVKHDLHVFAYVIMPEHVHLVVQPQRDEYKIEHSRKSIKKPVAQRAMNYLRQHSPEWMERLTARPPGGDVERHFWQPGGGYDRNIISNKVLLATILYIHANPVRRGLVANPTDWEWSSARFYEGFGDVKLEMDATFSMLNI